MKTFTFFLALLRTSIIASISLRTAFMIESALMIGNNLIFFSMWWIFFRQFNDVKGWQLPEMYALMTVGMISYGLTQICFGGVKHLARSIMNGDLDPFMTQPKNLLLHLIGSKSLSKGWGYLMSAAVLIVLGKLTAFPTLLLIVVCGLFGCLIIAACSIMAHSLAFWLGSIESVSRRYCDSLYLFILYPPNIYSGVLQIIMFTLIPAGIVGYIPVELIREFSFLKLFILIASSVAFFAFSFFVFNCGLKRYESGNRFGMRL